MPDLSYLLKSKELKEKSRASSKRRLSKDIMRPKSIEEYIDFLEEIKELKKELNAPKLPHPRMKGEIYSI